MCSQAPVWRMWKICWIFIFQHCPNISSDSLFLCEYWLNHLHSDPNCRTPQTSGVLFSSKWGSPVSLTKVKDFAPLRTGVGMCWVKVLPGLLHCRPEALGQPCPHFMQGVLLFVVWGLFSFFLSFFLSVKHWGIMQEV